MSTRFYFDMNSLAPPGSWMGAEDASWTQGNLGSGPFSLVADPTRMYDGPAGTEALGANAVAATGPRNVLITRWISEPLPAGSLSGTMTAVIRVSENVAASDCMLQIVVRVVGGTNTVRGVAYAGQTAATVSTSRTASNYELVPGQPASRILVNIPLTTVTIQANDRLNVEVGVRTVSSAAVDVSHYSNLREDYRDISLMVDRLSDGVSFSGYERDWIEFSADLFGSLNSEEFRFRTNGVKLNGLSAAPFVDLTSIEGLDSPEVGLSSADRNGAHGSYVSATYDRQRTITLNGNIYASNTALETYLDSLKANFEPTPSPRNLYFGTDAGTRMIRAKSLGVKFSKDSSRRLGVVTMQAQLVAADPRIYSPITKTETEDATIARMYDFTPGGNRDTPAIISLMGPWANPYIRLVNRYGVMTLDFNGNTLTQYDWIDIDLDARTVTFVSNVNWRSKAAFSGTWINLAPDYNMLYHNVTAGTSQSQIVVTYNPAWR